jgi:hypothetical protein
MLNYETETMSRDEIVAATYECYDRLAELKRSLGRIDDAACQDVRSQTAKARDVIAEIDAALEVEDEAERERRILAARERIGRLREQKSKTAEELRWAVGRAFAPAITLLGFVTRAAFGEAWRLLLKRASRYGSARALPCTRP